MALCRSWRSPKREEALPSSYRLLVQSFRRTLLAENKAPRTVQTYTEALRLFGEYLARQCMPTEVANITREHVESFIAGLLTRFKPATASNRYRALQVFFKWCVEEGERTTTPMINMKPPIIPEEPPRVLSDDDLRRLLKACEGKAFAERRDTAFVRQFTPTSDGVYQLTSRVWGQWEDARRKGVSWAHFVPTARRRYSDPRWRPGGTMYEASRQRAGAGDLPEDNYSIRRQRGPGGLTAA